MKKLNVKGCAAALAAVLAISSISLSVSAESGTRDTKEIKHSMTAENKIEDDVTVKIVSVDGSSVTAEIMMIGQPFNDDKEPDTDEKPDDLPDIDPQDMPEPIAADDEDRPAPDKDTPPEKPSEDEWEKPFDEGEMPKDMTVTFTLTSDTVYTDADGEKATSAIVTEDAVLTVVLDDEGNAVSVSQTPVPDDLDKSDAPEKDFEGKPEDKPRDDAAPQKGGRMPKGEDKED